MSRLAEMWVKVAVMRKMITTLNAMLRDNVAWQPISA